jgi:hypothetical protein
VSEENKKQLKSAFGSILISTKIPLLSHSGEIHTVASREAPRYLAEDLNLEQLSMQSSTLYYTQLIYPDKAYLVIFSSIDRQSDGSHPTKSEYTIPAESSVDI